MSSHFALPTFLSVKANVQFLMVVFFWFIALAASAFPARAESETRALKKIFEHAPKDAVGVSVLDLESGDRLFELNAETPLKPASVQKILTSAAALQTLGADCTFKTRLYGDMQPDGTVPVLYISGGADPSLTTESVWMMARALKKRGVEKVAAIQVDLSLVPEDQKPQGDRAYEAGVSALNYNYNSVSFDVCPTKTARAARVTADPFDAGIVVAGSIKTVAKPGVSNLNISRSGSSPSAALQYRVSGEISRGGPCETIYRSVDRPEILFVRELGNVLRMLRVGGAMRLAFGPLATQAPLIYEQESQPLIKILFDLNHFSTNTIAETLAFHLGQGTDGKLYKSLGIERLASMLKIAGVSEDQFCVMDGSGLSHSNRLSAEAVVRLLEYAYRHEEMRPEFETSLSVADRSGTLKKRKFLLEGGLMRGKTGTLDDVSALAGYVVSHSGRRLAFAVLTNQMSSKEEASKVEEQLVRLIAAL